MGTAPLPAKDFDPTARRTFNREPTADDAAAPASFKRPRQPVQGKAPTAMRQSNVDHVRSASRCVATVVRYSTHEGKRGRSDELRQSQDRSASSTGRTVTASPSATATTSELLALLRPGRHVADPAVTLQRIYSRSIA
jgi:hypothetical protein